MYSSSHLTQVLPDAGVNPTTGTRAGSTAFYSLDEGKTRFYDLMQMVEFYTLNQGALNTRLSQVREGGACSQKKEEVVSH